MIWVRIHLFITVMVRYYYYFFYEQKKGIIVKIMSLGIG